MLLDPCLAAGEDMLETFDTDDEVSLLAASIAGLIEEQTVHKLAQSPRYHDGATDLEKSPPAPSPNLGFNITTLLEQKKRRRPFSSTPKFGSCLRSFLASCTAKMARTGQPGCLPKKGSTLIVREARDSMTRSLPFSNELILQVRQKPVMASS